MLSYSSNEAETGKIYIPRPGAYGLIKNENGLIAVIFTGKRYFLPGGGLEPNENLKQCLERECHEEIGAVISNIKKFAEINCYFYSTTRNFDMESIGHFFTCEINAFTQEKTEPDHELTWLKPEEAIEKLYLSNQREAIRLLGK